MRVRLTPTIRSLIKSLRKDVQRVEDENKESVSPEAGERNPSAQECVTAARIEYNGVGQRETDADVQKLKDKVQQLEKER